MKQTDRSINSHDEIVFAEETPEVSSEKALEPWKLMIVDDEEAVHSMTRQVLEDFSFEHRSLTNLNAYSGKDAMQLIQQHPDVALVLLDVVMETDHAGLEVIRYIREE